MVIPALHDAANDQPSRYTPVCGQSAGIAVCLNPAYRKFLPAVTAALSPVLGEVTGLPGAPARATQVAGVYSSADGGPGAPMTISGQPPVLGLPLDSLNLPGGFGGTATQFAEQLKLLAAHVLAGASAGPGTPAQQAVQAALLQGAGVPFSAQPGVLSLVGLPSWASSSLPPNGNANGPGPATGPVYAAAGRLAALSPAARHAWLGAHLGALRSGQLTLGQLP